MSASPFTEKIEWAQQIGSGNNGHKKIYNFEGSRGMWFIA